MHIGCILKVKRGQTPSSLHIKPYFTTKFTINAIWHMYAYVPSWICCSQNKNRKSLWRLKPKTVKNHSLIPNVLRGYSVSSSMVWYVYANIHICYHNTVLYMSCYICVLLTACVSRRYGDSYSHKQLMTTLGQKCCDAKPDC